MAAKARIGILGASGYTGGELVRVLLRHPRADIALLTAERSAGKAMREVFSHFSPFALPQLLAIEGLDWSALALDVAFCALPHATTQKVIKELLAKAPATKVIDLSADSCVCEMVWARSPRAGTAERGGLRSNRDPSTRDQTRATHREPRLLHHLRPTAVNPPHQKQSDRA